MYTKHNANLHEEKFHMPQTKALFAEFRATLARQTFEDFLTNLTQLAPLWRRCPYKIFGYLLDEFAWFWRKNPNERRDPAISLHAFRAELVLRNSSPLRVKLARLGR